jgi:hypothetical protein
LHESFVKSDDVCQMNVTVRLSSVLYVQKKEKKTGKMMMIVSTKDRDEKD